MNTELADRFLWVPLCNVVGTSKLHENQFLHHFKHFWGRVPFNRHSSPIFKFWKNRLFICSIDRVLIADLRNI